MRHLGWTPVLETTGLVSGEEGVEVGPGAAGPGDLATAQGGGHDEPASTATVASLLSIMSHTKTKHIVKTLIFGSSS